MHALRPGTRLPVQTMVAGIPALTLKSSVARVRASHCSRLRGSVSPPPREPSGEPMTVLVIVTPLLRGQLSQMLGGALVGHISEPHFHIFEAECGRLSQPNPQKVAW